MERLTYKGIGENAMKEYIEKNAILNMIKKYGIKRENKVYGIADIGDVFRSIEALPVDGVVSKTAFEQVVWERDTALRQLREDYGVGLGEKKRDVAEVRPGEWIPVDEKRDAFDCSKCDAMVSRMMNYCPNCGAKMDKQVPQTGKMIPGKAYSDPVHAAGACYCRECKSFYTDENISPNTGYCSFAETVMSFDDFCSSGEPKDIKG